MVRGKVTRNINTLDIALSEDERERLIFYKINDKMVREADSNLHSSYDTFQELHDRYLKYADLEDNEDKSD